MLFPKEIFDLILKIHKNISISERLNFTIRHRNKNEIYTDNDDRRRINYYNYYYRYKKYCISISYANFMELNIYWKFGNKFKSQYDTRYTRN